MIFTIIAGHDHRWSKPAAASTRATIGDYQLHLHRYRPPHTKDPLVTNTQLARTTIRISHPI